MSEIADITFEIQRIPKMVAGKDENMFVVFRKQYLDFLDKNGGNGRLVLDTSTQETWKIILRSNSLRPNVFIHHDINNSKIDLSLQKDVYDSLGNKVPPNTELLDTTRTKIYRQNTSKVEWGIPPSEQVNAMLEAVGRILELFEFAFRNIPRKSR